VRALLRSQVRVILLQDGFLFVEILEGIKLSLFIGIRLERDHYTGAMS
jgi:hypothetical protein